MVRRDLIGGVSGALVALALLVFLLGVIEPAFRPMVLGSLLFGSVCAVVLVRHRRRGGHPSISSHSTDREETPRIDGRRGDP